MNQNYYTTSSLALAAAIHLASSSKLQTVEKSPDSRKALFIFNLTPDLENIVQRFWGQSLLLDAFSYFEATKYVKARLYETRESEVRKENSRT